MKFAVVCLFVVGIVLVSAEEYTHKYDNIDIDQILNNGRLLKRYVDCLLERGSPKCPPEVLELKRVLSDALESECAKCSEYQKTMVKKVIKFLVQNKPQEWTDLKAKYDPEGKYTKKYENMAEEEGVQL